MNIPGFEKKLFFPKERNEWNDSAVDGTMAFMLRYTCQTWMEGEAWQDAYRIDGNGTLI